MPTFSTLFISGSKTTSPRDHNPYLSSRDLSPDPPTTSTSQPTGPTDSPTTTTDNSGASCCSSVKFQSSGDIGAAQPDLLGSYRRISTDSTGRAVYRKDDTFLHYVNDVAHRLFTSCSSLRHCEMLGSRPGCSQILKTTCPAPSSTRTVTSVWTPPVTPGNTSR